LAAGKGTRINAKKKNKVLLPIAGRPMLSYATELLRSLKIQPLIVVVGFKSRGIIDFLGPDFIFVKQGKLLGTGHAVKQSLPFVPADKKQVLVLYADHSAFYQPKMIKNLIRRHCRRQSVLTFITVDRLDPTGYGRILRNKQGKLIGIREEKNTTAKQKKIKEINAGTYCFDRIFLDQYIAKIKKNPVSKEYYLTDLVEIALADNLRAETYKIKDKRVSLGVNTRRELRIANRKMQQSLKQKAA